MSATDVSLIFVGWKPPGNLNDSQGNSPFLEQAASQLQEYFSQKRTSFTLPVSFKGTIFQEKVWNALTKIPFGKSASYSEIASRIGSEKSYRAVGSACGANPISIIIPCHRVLAVNNGLGGYSGGLEKKEWLLKLEGL